MPLLTENPLLDLTLKTTEETVGNTTATSETDTLGIETDDRGFGFGTSFLDTLICCENMSYPATPSLDVPSILSS